MFKALLKKVEETTSAVKNDIVSSLKSKDTPKPNLDNNIKENTNLPDAIKKGIDISLQTVKLGPPSPPANLYKENIDFHPGATFLQKYREKLIELHSNNVILSKKAEAVDRKLPTLVQHCTNHNELWWRLHNEVTKLPELSANVSNIRNQIDFVLVKMDELELLLNTHVEAHYANKVTEYKENLESETTKYQIQKQKELASLEGELATSRAKYEMEKASREREQARLMRIEQEQQRRKKEEEELRDRRRREEEDIRERKRREEEEIRDRKRKAEEDKRKAEEEAQERKRKAEEDKAHQDKLRTAFGSAFEHDVEQYKKFGAVTIAKKDESVTPVDNILPEENAVEVLEDFLKEETEVPTSSNTKEVDTEGSETRGKVEEGGVEENVEVGVQEDEIKKESVGENEENDE